MSKIMDEIREEASDLKAKEIATSLLRTNLSPEEISKHCELSTETVKALIANKLLQ